MELYTTQAISALPNHCRLFAINSSLLLSKTSLPQKRSLFCLATRGLYSRNLHFKKSLWRATPEETSSGNQYFEDERGSVITIDSKEKVSDEESKVEMNESQADEPMQTSGFLDKVNIDTEDAYSFLLYGGGAFAVVYLASAVIGAIDSIPVFPKLMEVVGLGYSFWFTSRYLLFKKNRDELTAKIEEIKNQVLGSKDAY